MSNLEEAVLNAARTIKRKIEVAAYMRQTNPQMKEYWEPEYNELVERQALEFAEIEKWL